MQSPWRSVVATSGLLLVLLLTTLPLRAEPLAVSVSILPQKFFVDRVGGERVRVQVLVAPGQSPHNYDPSPRQMVDLARARVWFRVGVGFEDAWLRRIRENHPQLQIVDQREGITLLDEHPDHVHEEPHEDGHSHDHEHAHEPAADHGHAHAPPAGAAAGVPAAADKDPHIWTSPPLGKRMAAQVRDTLSRLDPAGAAEYAANYATLAAALDALDEEIRATLAGVAHRRFLVFHPAWAYFAETYGLEQISIEKGGKEPGARGLAAIIEQARAGNIRVVFAQRQFNTATAEAVSRGIDGRVVQVDPLAEDYLENMRQVAAAFREALR